MGGPQGRSGRVQKMSPQPRFDPRTVQQVQSRYNNWAILAYYFSKKHFNIILTHMPTSCKLFKYTYTDSALASENMGLSQNYGHTYLSNG
jgi:hypothetical protein